MDKKEFFQKQTFQKQAEELMRGVVKNPEEALKKLQELQEFLDKDADKESLEYCAYAVVIRELTGDALMRLKKIPEAEKAYQEAVQHSTKLYQADKEKNDFRLGTSYYKLGAFYRVIIGCNLLRPKMQELSEQQKKVFDLSLKCYKNAIGCTMENAKKGNGMYVTFHANCLADLLILHAAAGDYEQAILCGRDAVRLNKAVYEKLDDKVHAVRLANQMNALASVYMFAKNPQLAMESLEDAVYVLEEHEGEDPMNIGVMLARYYISLGSCYVMIEEEKENAEEAYKKGLERMKALNDKSNNRLIDDVIQSYVFVGDYYKKVNKEVEAKAHYTWAMKMASDMSRATKKPKYEGLIKQLQAKI